MRFDTQQMIDNIGHKYVLWRTKWGGCQPTAYQNSRGHGHFCPYTEVTSRMN